MPPLVKVTRRDNSRVYHLNPAHIVGLSEHRNGGTTVFLTSLSELVVAESIDDLTAS